jgi:hypothetical protein
MQSQVKSKQRVADHGEVFTPAWMVEAMLDLVKGETERIDSRFLESACGDGNFLVQILRRKLAAVELKYGKSDFERRHYALLGLMCIYGIELLPDNIADCRANLLEIFAEYLNLDRRTTCIAPRSSCCHRTSYTAMPSPCARALKVVKAVNPGSHDDAPSMSKHTCQPIIFAEWGYLGKGKFQRRDFRLDNLTIFSSARRLALRSKLGKHEIFKPTKTYPPMTVDELAAAAPEVIA